MNLYTHTHTQRESELREVIRLIAQRYAYKGLTIYIYIHTYYTYVYMYVYYMFGTERGGGQ